MDKNQDFSGHLPRWISVHFGAGNLEEVSECPKPVASQVAELFAMALLDRFIEPREQF